MKKTDEQNAIEREMYIRKLLEADDSECTIDAIKRVIAERNSALRKLKTIVETLDTIGALFR